MPKKIIKPKKAPKKTPKPKGRICGDHCNHWWNRDSCPFDDVKPGKPCDEFKPHRPHY